MKRYVVLLALVVLVPFSAWMLLGGGGESHAPYTVAADADDGSEPEAEVRARTADGPAEIEGPAERDDPAASDRVVVEDVEVVRAIEGKLVRGGKIVAEIENLRFAIRRDRGGATGRGVVDERGRFTYPIQSREVDGSTLFVRGEIDGQVVGARAMLPLDGTDDLPRIDVGTLELQSLTLIARGRVVDDTGAPIEGASVRAFPAREVTPEQVTNGLRSGVLDERERVAMEIALVQHEIARLEQAMVAQRAAANAFSSNSSPTRSIDVETMRRLERNHMRMAQLHDNRRRTPLAVLETGPDGTFELHGLATDLPLRLHARAEHHKPVVQRVEGVGAWLDVTLVRTASIVGTAILPPGVPTHAVEFSLRREGTVHETEGTSESGRIRFGFEDVEPGQYQLDVNMLNLPEPVASIGPLDLLPGPPTNDWRVHEIDLRGSVHHFVFRARSDRGESLTEIASPLLVHLDDEVRGFSWRDGKIEFFAARDSLELTLINQGYKAETIRVAAGASDIVFRSLHPIEVLLPGLRSVCGPDRRVRVSMILESGTGLPQSIRGIDQMTGDSRSYSRWHMSKSGGAWLDEDDLVQVPLIRNGKYNIVVRLHEEGVSGDVSIGVGSYDVVLDDFSPHRIVVNVDLEQMRNGIRQLEGRKNANRRR